MLHNKIFIFIIIIFAILLSSCSNIRESAGVTRKSIDEFQAIENPPLVIPPDFNLVSPDQLQQKDIENIENELAQEILFGLDNENTDNVKVESCKVFKTIMWKITFYNQTEKTIYTGEIIIIAPPLRGG